MNYKAKISCRPEQSKTDEIEFEINVKENYQLLILSENFKGKRLKDDNLFDLIAELRRFLESKGWRLLINASRPDVNVSNAYRNTNGGGRQAYLLKMGESASDKDLLDMFEAVRFELTATAPEQEEFYLKWIESL